MIRAGFPSMITLPMSFPPEQSKYILGWKREGWS